MNAQSWHEGHFADLLMKIDYSWEGRKNNLLAVACARVLWDGLTKTAHREFERIERRVEQVRSPRSGGAGIDDYAARWLAPHASADVENSLEFLHMLFNDTASTIHGCKLALPKAVERAWAACLRDIFANPFRPVRFNPDWRTTEAVQLAKRMYNAREFAAMPILANGLEDAGCENTDILDHCRGTGPHVRGCWVLDLVMGKK
jgi:hypothetical protein